MNYKYIKCNPEELLDIIEVKGKEIAEALAILRRGESTG